MRRIVTTSLNYFVLISIPFPRLDLDSLDGQMVVAAARELHELYLGVGGTSALWRAAELRADIDATVLQAYGEALPSLVLMVGDFPLLDRAQPRLPGETRSTITSDFVQLRVAQRSKDESKELVERVEFARRLGAIPYVPSELGPSLMSDSMAETRV
jgi:hypothetical protein